MCCFSSAPSRVYKQEAVIIIILPFNTDKQKKMNMSLSLS